MGVGSKSDYRKVMSQSLLAPVVKNPWRNPMKTGSVANPYSAARKVVWHYGHRNTNVSAPSNYVTWDALDGAVGNDDGASAVVMNRWRVTPGNRRITEQRIKAAFLDATYVIGSYVEVWRKNGTNYERVATSADQGPLTEEQAGYKNWNIDISGAPLEVTVEAGYEYYRGIRIVRNNANAGAPYFGRTVDTNFTDGSVAIAMASTYDQSDDIVPVAGETGCVVTTGNYLFALDTTYESDQLMEMKLVNGTDNMAGKYVVPWAPEEPYFVSFYGAYSADTYDFRIDWGYIGLGTWASAVLYPTTIDTGKTTPGTNTLFHFNNSVALADIGGFGQETCRYDLHVGFDIPNSKNNLVWQNTMREAALHSHATVHDAARGTRYAQSVPIEHFQAFGQNAGSTLEIRVGVGHQVYVADSQTISGINQQLRSPNLDRLGNRHNALTKPRGYIMHGQSGQSISAMLQGIFRSTTPGVADASELMGFGSEWVISGVGINDIATSPPTSDAEVDEKVAQVTSDLLAIIKVLLAAGEKVSIVGIPPDSYPTHTAYIAAAAVKWNRALCGIALTHGLTFYNPWPDMVDPSTINDSAPEFTAAYTYDGGLHYSSAGGAIVVSRSVQVEELGGWDLRYMWS